MSYKMHPSSWSLSSLGELGQIVTGKTPNTKKSNYFGGNIPFVKPGDLNDGGYIKRTVDTLSEEGFQQIPNLPEKAIMVTCIGNLGKVGITTCPSSTNQQINSVIVDKNIEYKYLYYYLISMRWWLEQESSATTVAIINKSKFSNAPIVVPPLNEQKQIAAKLDELLAQVDTLKTRLDTIPTILKRFRQSVLAAAVSGKLTEEWRKSNKTEDIEKFVELTNSEKKGLLKVRIKKGWDEELNLFNLPKNWAWVLNHKLAEDSRTAICAGPFGTIFKAKDFRDEGVPIIFLRHVKEGGFNQRKPKCMDLKVWKEFHQEYSVYGGELLVAKLGEPPGESCIYPENIGTSMVTPDVLKMNVDSRVVEIKYLLYFFNSPISKQMIGDLAFGATRLRIDIAMFKSFPIPMPPREEQTEIVIQVEKLFAFADQIEQRVKDAQKRVNNLTQSILAKAFRGELTAEWREQNPDLISGENSAEALLEKIKEEKDVAEMKIKLTRRSVKKKTGKNMKKDQIICIVEALESAKSPLSAQALLAQSGYPSDASIDEIERFFIEVREKLKLGLITKERLGNEDIFTLV